MAQNFFYDFAAYTQFFFGIPLFIVAERLIAKNMRSAAQDFANSGVVAAADQRELAAVEAEVAVKRRRVRPDRGVHGHRPRALAVHHRAGAVLAVRNMRDLACGEDQRLLAT